MLEANVEGNTSFTLTHGLGEIPALVDVQVKSINNPNKDFVFTGVGKYRPHRVASPRKKKF